MPRRSPHLGIFQKHRLHQNNLHPLPSRSHSLRDEPFLPEQRVVVILQPIPCSTRVSHRRMITVSSILFETCATCGCATEDFHREETCACPASRASGAARTHLSVSALVPCTQMWCRCSKWSQKGRTSSSIYCLFSSL